MFAPTGSRFVSASESESELSSLLSPLPDDDVLSGTAGVVLARPGAACFAPPVAEGTAAAAGFAVSTLAAVTVAADTAFVALTPCAAGAAGAGGAFVTIPTDGFFDSGFSPPLERLVTGASDADDESDDEPSSSSPEEESELLLEESELEDDGAGRFAL